MEGHWRVCARLFGAVHLTVRSALSWAALPLSFPPARARSRYYELAAAQGDPAAQAELGFMQASGAMGGLADAAAGEEGAYDGDADARSALNLYFAASAGDHEAQMALGFRHSVGWGAPRQCHAAVLYYQPVAERVVEAGSKPGAPAGVEKIRLEKEAEKGASGSQKDMVQYYVYTADMGNAMAQTAIGQLLNFGGHGVERDHAKALQYLTRAAAQGDADAAAHLGHMYANGLGTAQDNATAIRLFKEAIEASEHHVALHGLGYMHLGGYGVDKDPAAALKLFSRAAERGSADAHFYLGAMHTAALGVRKDFSKAFYHFSLAAHQGHTVAIYNLAVLHSAGLGAPMSCKTALSLLKTVAERGEVVAGLLAEAHRRYAVGDHTAALAVYLKMALMGFEVAQSNAAFMIERSEGDGALFGGNRTRALEVALQMYWLAAEQGSDESLLKVGDAHYYGRGARKSARDAAAVYRAAASQRQPRAMFNMGLMHEHGLGVPRDAHLAKRFYDRARSTSSEAAVPTLLALGKVAAGRWLEARCGPTMCMPTALRELVDRAWAWALATDGFAPEDFFDGPESLNAQSASGDERAEAAASVGRGASGRAGARNAPPPPAQDAGARESSSGQHGKDEAAQSKPAVPKRSPWADADWESALFTLVALALGAVLMRRNALRARAEAARRALALDDARTTRRADRDVGGV